MSIPWQTAKERNVRIWEVSSGKLIRKFTTKEAIGEVKFLEGNSLLIIVEARSIAHAYDYTSGQQIYTLLAPSNTELYLSGNHIIAHSYGGDSIIIYGITDGKKLKTVKFDLEVRKPFVIDPSEKFLLTVLADTSIAFLDLGSNKVLYKLPCVSGYPEGIVFSSDGRKFLPYTYANTYLNIFDLLAGERIDSVIMGEEIFNKAFFVNNDKDIIIVSNPGLQRFFIQFDPKSGDVHSWTEGKLLAINPSGDFICYKTNSYTYLFDCGTCTTKPIAENSPIEWENAEFSPVGDLLALTSDEEIRVLDLTKGTSITKISGAADEPDKVVCSTDESTALVFDTRANRIKLISLRTGELISQLTNLPRGYFNSTPLFELSNNGEFLALCCDSLPLVQIIEAKTGHVIDKIFRSAAKLKFSPDDDHLMIATPDSLLDYNISEKKLVVLNGYFLNDKMMFEFENFIYNRTATKLLQYQAFEYLSEYQLNVWETSKGNMVFTIQTKGALSRAEFSHESKKLLLSFPNRTEIRDGNSGELIITLPACGSSFNSNGSMVISAFSTTSFNPCLWDAVTGQKIKEYLGSSQWLRETSISPDGSLVYAINDTFYIWNAVSEELIFKFPLLQGYISLAFASGHLVGARGGEIILQSIKTGEEDVHLVLLNGSDWALIHPSGLFDATPGAMEKMYYVQGLDIIEFEQLKDKYWEPGLYEKIMKGESLRDVEALDKKLELWPEVKELVFHDNYEKLQISLENRGGGIGKVQVFLNGKEIINDARGKEIRPLQKSAQITIGLKDHPLLVNGVNKVEVLTWNAVGTLSGKRESAEFLVEKESHLPEVYIVSIGVSDYEGSKIDLKYASKDAFDFLHATSLAARNLFTEAGTHTYLLNTEKDNPLQPTKSEITGIFREIGRKAKAEDVVIVYLSGHGLSIGGENGDLYYLTRDAFSPNPEIYSDPTVKDKCTISGSEMIELLKSIPATKQVLIIDACSSGKLVDNLVEKRDIESSIVKALDRMKERAGLHIITGSAADAVSYEASRYGQGLLTYSILAGMKGLALKDNRTVDVSLLMQHAREMVPKLAQGIGGIQEPRIFSPKGAESFDIGLILEKDKQLIPLAKEKEIFVNSVFQDVNEFSDLLSLGELIDQKLEDISSEGKGAPMVFWGVNSFPGAYKISGNYSIEGNKIEVRFKILKDKTGNKTVTVTGDRNALDALAEMIIKIALEGI